MTDIVERLRHEMSRPRTAPLGIEEAIELGEALKDAADEIEELRSTNGLLRRANHAIGRFVGYEPNAKPTARSR